MYKEITEKSHLITGNPLSSERFKENFLQRGFNFKIRYSLLQKDQDVSVRPTINTKVKY